MDYRSRDTSRVRLCSAVWILVALHFVYALSQSLVFFVFGITGAQDGDPLGLGVTLMAKSAPTIVVALVGGTLADRMPRRTLIVVGFVGIAATNAGLALTLPVYQLGVPTQAISFLSGFASALAAPALYAILPSVTPKDTLVEANAAVRSAANVSRIAGPALGGIAVASHISVAPLLWLCTAFMSIAAALAMLLHPRQHKRASKSPLLTDLKAARSLLRDYPGISYVLPYWAFFIAFSSGVLSTTLPVHVVAATGPTVWGWMLSSSACGYLAGSISQIVRPARSRLLLLSVAASGVVACEMLAPVFSTRLPLLCAAAFVSGFALEVSGVWWGAYMQRSIPDSILGKVSSLDYSISFGFTPVGYLIVGAASLYLPATTVLIVGAVSILLGVAATLLMVMRLEARAGTAG